jgi:hypothetical protein
MKYFTAKKLIPLFGFAALCLVLQIAPAHAVVVGDDITTVSNNIVKSTHKLPGLISGFAYLLGSLFGVLGILKIKNHVENPQTQLREGISRLFASGALLALPYMYRVMRDSIGLGSFSPGAGFSIADFMSGGFGFLSSFVPTANVNEILMNIITSVGGTPGLVSAISYLLAMVIGYAGILKLREHIDSPENVPLREGITRFLAAGALFTLPFIFTVFQTTISGGTSLNFGNVVTSVISTVGGFLGVVNSGGCGLGTILPSWMQTLLNGATGHQTSVGDVICNTMTQSAYFPAFLTALSYLFGIVIGLWAVLKFKDNVLKPDQTSIWEGVSRMLAAGCFFSLPYVTSVAQATLGMVAPFLTTGFGSPADPTSSGLDVMMAQFVGDIYGPALFVMNFFGYVSGTILLMIAISRLMKSAQEGARGPGGIGTMMTFIAAGSLISLSPMLASFGISLFGCDITQLCSSKTVATISYLSPDDQTHILPVIEATLQFMIVLGIVSFARGIFIIREVAEGHGQASMMSGMTHLIGGALAINLGPVMNAVQSTLGLDTSQTGVLFN